MGDTHYEQREGKARETRGSLGAESDRVLLRDEAREAELDTAWEPPQTAGASSDCGIPKELDPSVYLFIQLCNQQI